MTQQPGEASTFREAMRRVANTVYLITTHCAGEDHGIVATAVSSLSMDPPSLLICINANASVRQPLHQSGKFCVNILAGTQSLISRHFGDSSKRQERFNSADWRADEAGTPHLQSAVASVFCSVAQRVEWATHTIFVGTVDRVLLGEVAVPLLYLGGQYHDLAQRSPNAHAIAPA
jgi:flavin reductase (DIM6/NTAB) family NADH-FMN oxidoreductase RutF